MATHSIFTRFLAELGVPHTAFHSDGQFRNMAFKSLYGLSHLLGAYGVPNRGVRFADKSLIRRLTAPFLAQTDGGIFVIVTRIDPARGIVEYDSRGEKMIIALEDFLNGWNGVALLAFPHGGSIEPDYRSHRLTEIVSGMSKYVLAASAAIVLAYFFVSRELYAHFSTVLLTLFNAAGLYFSCLLLQKTLNIHSASSDRVCGVLEDGGCDSIMELDASRLLGVFAWSEIGFAYFGISLAALLLFPDTWPYLALCNLFCLPYTVWSIWYQKFRARHWCTLCVGVQAVQWANFFCYLAGGWLAGALPLRAPFFILLAAYVFATLFINLILGIFKKLPCHETYTNA